MQSLKEWACAKIGGTNANMSVTEATLRFATEMLDSLNDSKYLDEEGLTSSFLGLMLAQLPWTTLAFAPPNGSEEACYWSQYSKYGKGEFSESRSGADFALVVRTDADNVRVVIFQAKKEKDSKNHAKQIQVHQWPAKKEGQKERRDPQFKVLALKCAYIMKRIKKKVALNDLNWVYYLGMMEDGLRCIPLSKMEDSLNHSQSNSEKDDWVQLNISNSTDLLSLLTKPSDDYAKEEFGWLPMTLSQAKTVLPTLLELSDIFIVDEGKGGVALELEVSDSHTKLTSKFQAAPTEFKMEPPSSKEVVKLRNAFSKKMK